MNILDAKIVQVQSVGFLSQVNLHVNSQTMHSLIVDIATFAPLEEGMAVKALFKESEVYIATPQSFVSAANAFVSPVEWVNQGEIVSEVAFEFEGNEIVSMITTASLKRLGVEVGKSFMWFVKANEVTLKKMKNI